MYMMLQEIHTSTHTSRIHTISLNPVVGGNTIARCFSLGEAFNGTSTTFVFLSISFSPSAVVHADLAHPELLSLYDLVGTLNV